MACQASKPCHVLLLCGCCTAENARSARVTDALLNWETVKYFTNEPLEEQKYGEAIDAYQVREA